MNVYDFLPIFSWKLVEIEREREREREKEQLLPVVLSDRPKATYHTLTSCKSILASANQEWTKTMT